MKFLKALLLIFLVSCSHPEIPIQEEIFLDEPWLIVSAKGENFQELEGLCFTMFSEDEILLVHDGEEVIEGPYYWEQIGENIFEIDEIGTIYVYPIEETARVDWEIEVKVSAFINTALVVEECLKWD